LFDEGTTRDAFNEEWVIDWSRFDNVFSDVAHILTPCLLPSKTRFDESKALKPQTDETILFFSIDDQSNTDCK